MGLSLILTSILSWFTTEQPAFNILYINWNPTDCQFMLNCEESVIEEHFSIATLQPATKEGQHLVNCENDYDFSIRDSTKIELQRFWRPVIDTDINVWQEAWELSGTCMRPMITSDQYFSSAIALYKAYEFLYSLEMLGIVPSEDFTYTRQSIQDAFPDTKIEVYCALDEEDSYLLTLAFCLDTEFNRVDCPPIVESNCGESIKLPPISS